MFIQSVFVSSLILLFLLIPRVRRQYYVFGGDDQVFIGLIGAVLHC